MMSPLEYLFVMMMKTQNPDPDSLAKVEPASGVAVVDRNQIVVNKEGRIEMRTILMQSQDSSEDTLEAPLRITKQWEPMFKIGAPLAIRIDESGQTYNARVSRIVTVRDDEGETTQVIARMSGTEAALQPGLTATAIMAQPQKFN
jgi:hypothetical protein